MHIVLQEVSYICDESKYKPAQLTGTSPLAHPVVDNWVDSTVGLEIKKSLEDLNTGPA